MRGSLNDREHLRFCLCVSVRACLCVCVSVCQSAWSCFHFENPIAYSTIANTFAAESILSRVNSDAVCNYLVVQLRLWSSSQRTARGTQKTWTAEDAQNTPPKGPTLGRATFDLSVTISGTSRIRLVTSVALINPISVRLLSFCLPQSFKR